MRANDPQNSKRYDMQKGTVIVLTDEEVQEALDLVEPITKKQENLTNEEDFVYYCTLNATGYYSNSGPSFGRKGVQRAD